MIYAPGSAVNQPAYDFPETPLLYFFEGGAYGEINFATVPGDQFIGGSSPGQPEPAFNDGGSAGGISAQNGTYDFSGGAGTLASAAPANATTIHNQFTHQRLHWLGCPLPTVRPTRISKVSGTTITLGSGLSKAEAAGTAAFGSREPPIAHVTAAAGQGATSVRLGASTTPLLRQTSVVIGADSYAIRGGRRRAQAATRSP